MNMHGWSTRVVVRYALLQLPALVLLAVSLFFVRQWVDIPIWLIWGIVGFWLAKDVVLFPFTWRSYDQRRLGHADSMVGLRGIAQDRLAPSGYVQVHGELWQAEVMGHSQPIDKGEGIRVQGTRGFTLLVQPDNSEGIESE
jgi:membrane-bound ClpP family serine protease